MKRLLSSLLPLLLMACLPAAGQAEGFFRASLIDSDVHQWPIVHLLLQIEDESSDGRFERTMLPNPDSAADCPQGNCWQIELLENGEPVTVLAQYTVFAGDRTSHQYLWLRYRSSVEPADGPQPSLKLSLESDGRLSNRTAWNQPLLYRPRTELPALSASPWPLLRHEWDEDLNVNYRALRFELDGPERDALLQSQRAWISYRDAFCNTLRDGDDDRLDRCLAQVTLTRATQLRDMLLFLHKR